jgi:ribosomal protein S18 acetylase RimI-like enzyme
MSVIRRIEASDVPRLFRVRAATDENRLTLDRLAALGINENSVREKLLSSHQGWLCEEQGSVVGFAMGDRSSGEMVVIAVLTHIRRGIGGALLEQVETWLFQRRLFVAVAYDGR